MLHDFERNFKERQSIKKMTYMVIVYVILSKIAIFGFIGWVVYKLMSHFQVL